MLPCEILVWRLAHSRSDASVRNILADTLHKGTTEMLAERQFIEEQCRSSKSRAVLREAGAKLKTSFPSGLKLDERSTVERVAEAKLPTSFGAFRLLGYRSRISTEEFVVLVRGDLVAGKSVLV